MTGFLSTATRGHSLPSNLSYPHLDKRMLSCRPLCFYFGCTPSWRRVGDDQGTGGNGCEHVCRRGSQRVRLARKFGSKSRPTDVVDWQFQAALAGRTFTRSMWYSWQEAEADIKAGASSHSIVLALCQKLVTGSYLRRLRQSSTHAQGLMARCGKTTSARVVV